MVFIVTVLLIAFMIAMLLYTAAAKINFMFNSSESKMNLTLLWLYPFLKAVVSNENGYLVLTIHLLNKSIYKKPLKTSKHKTDRFELIKLVKPKDINVNTAFGFRDPFVTGVACGAISAASQLIDIDSIQQNPDFLTNNDYIYVDATAKVNLGSALMNLYRTRNTKE